jgi:ABC-type glycerol-3-phosphate transport system substrate-binding protein
MKKMAVLCLAGMTAMSTIGITGVQAEETNYDVDNMDFENVEIRVAFRYTSGSETDGQSQWYYQALEEFNAENEGKIHVTDESISAESDYEEKLTTDFASGDTPNAFLQYGGSRAREYVEAGYVLDLTPYFEQYPDWYDGVQEFAWETTQFDGVEGTYGIPWSSYQLCLYYNKDLLEEAGVDVPESWDDLIEACEKLTEAGIQPFNYSDKDNYHYEHLMSELALKAYGTSIADDLANDVEAYNGEKMVAIYQLMKDMIDAGYWGDAILSTDFSTERNMFEAGQAAFTVDGTWNCGNFQNDSDTTLFDSQKIGVTRIPYINEEYKTTEMGGGSDTYYITTLNKSDEEIAATVKFIKYLTTVDAINDMCLSSPTTYAEKVTIDTGNYLLDEVNAIMAENTDSKLELPNYDTNTAAMDTIRNSLQALATGATAQEVGDDIVDKMSAYE